MFRNPTTHEPRIHLPTSKGDAPDFLTLDLIDPSPSRWHPYAGPRIEV
ncbi:hypothetical protein, partial [Sphingobium sp.]